MLAEKASVLRNFVAMSVKSQDPKPVSLSMCFSADLFNFLSRPKARRISSIRGHLPENYRTSYGMFGAVSHTYSIWLFQSSTQ